MTLFFNTCARCSRAAWQKFVTKYHINLGYYQNNFVQQYTTGGLFGFIERQRHWRFIWQAKDQRS
jgi:hypothetical protein